MPRPSFCLFLLYLLPSAALWGQIPGMDMAVMQKWSNAKVIRFSVVGVHSARTLVVAGDYEGKGDVADKITVEYTLDNKSGKIIGEAKITDGASSVTNLKSDGTNCPPPALKGSYEHFQLAKYSLSGNMLQITGTRNFPAASVSQYPASCSMKSIPGSTVEKFLFLTLMDARMLGMPNQPGNQNMSIAADRKSFTLRGAENWVWTYTPTLVQ